MDIEKLKEQGNEYLNIARATLIFNKSLYPALYAVSEGDWDNTLPISLNIENDEDKDEITTIMESLAPTCNAVLLIMDTHLIESDVPLDPEPVDLKNDPRALHAIICFLYTENECLMRQYRYIRENEDISFSMLDWEKFEEFSGRFQNPFKKN
jgi:hypothetical protein